MKDNYLTYTPPLKSKQVKSKRRQFFTQIAAGFGLASVIWVGIGVLSYWSLIKLIETFQQAIQSQELVENLEDLISLTKDAEIGQQGYILSGDKLYLQPYNNAVKAVEQKFKDLEKLTAANPKQQQQINTIKLMVREKFAELKQTIDLRREKGYDAALQVVLTNRGKKLMDEIRKMNHKIEDEEKQFSKVRSQSIAANIHNTIFTFSSGILLTFAILASVYYLIYREISDRKQTEAILEQERDFTSAILNTVGALVMVLDSQGKIVRFNRTCEEITGYSFAEVRGKQFWDVFAIPEEIIALKDLFEQLQINRSSNHSENYWITREGDRRRIAWLNTPLFNKDGSVEYVISSGIDITEHQRMQEQIHLLQTMMLAIGESQDFDSALEIVLRTVCETKGWNYGEAWIPFLEKNVLKCSPAWYSHSDGEDKTTLLLLEKFGRLSQEFSFSLGKGIPGRVWRSQQPEWQEDISQESETNFPRTHIALECGLKAGMGIPLIVREQVLAVLVFFKFESCKEDKRLVESISAVAAQLGSVIQRKQAEEALRESEARFQAFMNHSPVAAWITDEEGRILYLSQTYFRMFKLLTDDAIGKTIFDLYDADVASVFLENIRKVAQGDRIVEAIELAPRPDGTIGNFLVYKFPISSSSEQCLVGGVALDITDRKRAEEAMQRQFQRTVLLKQITEAIRQSLDAKQIFQTTATQIGQTFRVNRCVIHSYIAMPTPCIPIMSEYREPEYESIMDFDVPVIDNPYVEQLLAQDRAMRFAAYDIAAPNVSADLLLQSAIPACCDIMPSQAELKSMLAIRTSNRGKVNGIIAIYHYSEFRNWNEDEIELLEAVAAQVGLALAQARLLEQETQQREKLIIANAALQVQIAERQQAEEALSSANEKLKGWVNELERHNREIALLGEMSDILQACHTVAEACSAIATLVQPLFPGESGGVYLISASKNLVEAVSTWGLPILASQKLFAPDDCWALRRGRAHRVENMDRGLVCKHLHHTFPAESLCVPMMAQGEALGVLYLSSQKLGQLRQAKQQLAVMVTEQIALALANLKLQETLRNQSIRDPLTGLYNRRYLEESLEREVNRAERKNQSLGIIMIDVDYFKQFNDTFGHDAGDVVLQELGTFLHRHVRKSDIACRYGGEELMLILPESPLEVVQQRAERVREGVKHLNVHHRGKQLGAIALSIGVACFPEHGLTGEAVIQAADAALYQAKKEGRDRVVTAS